MSSTAPPIVSVVGASDAGKTTLIVKLIAELKRRGYRVATIKHHPHPVEVDEAGKDSWRYMQAGSDVAFLSTPDRLTMTRQVDWEWDIDEISRLAPDIDLVITEGYKRSTTKPRIEVSRRAVGAELLSQPEQLLAIATDHPFNLAVPQFALDDAAGLVDLVEAKLLRRGDRDSHSD